MRFDAAATIRAAWHRARPLVAMLLDVRPAPPGDGYPNAMASVARHLYVFGALLILASAPIAHSVGGNGRGLAAIGTLCVCGALVHLKAGTRLPLWCYPLSSAAGIVIVSIAIAYGGAFGPIYGLIYMWAVFFAFLFFGLGLAVAQTLLLAAAATVVLAPGERPLVVAAFGIVAFGTAATAGLLAHLGKQRIAELLTTTQLSEQRYGALVERLPLALYIDRLDDASSNIFTSRQIEAMFGYERRQWLDDPEFFVRILHPDDRARVLAEHAEVRAGGAPLLTEYRVLTRDGRVVWVRDGAVVAEDEFGEARLHGYMVDVSTEKQLEEDLRQSQKLEAIGRLAGGIAHDFNNLLTVISGYVEIASVRSGDAGVAAALEEARSAAMQASELTAQLLAFSRRQRLDSQVLVPNTLVMDLERLVARLIGDHIEVVVDLAADTGNVRADRTHVEQALLNLAINARDAMPNGGRLIFETAAIDLTAAFCAEHDGLQPGPFVRLSVVDRGVGMDEATLSHIFEPFFTTKEIGQGTGLGLATAYGTIRQSGGTIVVETSPGRGTRFDVYLPRVNESVAPAASEEPTAAEGSETILLVEDEPSVRTLTRRILEEHGYRVVEASGGGDALELFDSQQPPALLLTDVVMPGMSGREVAVSLRELAPELKVLYMSGYPERVIEPIDSRCFIQKPFTAAALTAAIRQLLDDTAVAA